MSEKLKGVVKLSEERYWEMYNAGTLDPYKQYETPQEPTYSQAQIDKKLTKLEEQIENAGSSVDAYSKTETDALLEDKADKDTTYTKTEVDDIKQDLQDQITTATGGEFSKVLVGGVYQPTFDADTKANADDIPTKTSDLTNDSGFITEEDIPAIPTKTSQLTNDSGFLTEIPSEYVTETELNNKGFLTSFTEQDPTVPAWAKAATKPSYAYSEITDKPTIPTALSQLTDDETHRVVTDTEKSTWNNKSNFSGNYNDLINKPTIPDVSSLLSQISALSGRDYIVEQGTNYVRWNGGLQICWNNHTNLVTSNYSFAKPFKDTNYAIAVAQEAAASGYTARPGIVKVDGEKFKGQTAGTIGNWYYIAVGLWK